jgi:hypothetical protein
MNGTHMWSCSMLSSSVKSMVPIAGGFNTHHIMNLDGLFGCSIDLDVIRQHNKTVHLLKKSEIKRLTRNFNNASEPVDMCWAEPAGSDYGYIVCNGSAPFTNDTLGDCKCRITVCTIRRFWAGCATTDEPLRLNGITLSLKCHYKKNQVTKMDNTKQKNEDEHGEMQ